MSRSKVAPLLSVVAVGAACSSTPPPAVPTPKPHGDTNLPVAVAPPVGPARWVSSGGATEIGPSVQGGTLVLVGGRRALAMPDGSLKTETAPSPEPIRELSVVPTASGAPRIVGRGVHGIYRFDDPLGAPVALARSEVDLVAMGGGPGLVAVWDVASDVPRYVDLETGKPRSFAGLPAVPARAIAFRDAKQGAAIFQAAGLATTTDGGASWKPVAEAVAGDALRVTGLRLRGDELRAFLYSEGRDAAVDPAQAKLGTLAEPEKSKEEPPLVRWIRVTGRDPLEAAIASGVRSDAGQATVASHGLFARVDLATGAVVALAEFAKGGGVNACTVGRAASHTWAACALSEENEGDLYDPFGVLELPLGASLGTSRPVLARNGEAELRTSPSGGAMLLGACVADEEGEACVRQPDGHWQTARVDAELVERGGGPLADGRIAMLRGLYEGDESPGGPEPEGTPPPALRAPFVVTSDAGGVEKRFAPSAWSGRAAGDFRVQSPVQEDADGTVTFTLANDEGVFVFRHPRSGEGKVRRQDGARLVRLSGEHGVALGAGKVRLTLDGGTTFVDDEAPAQLGALIDRAALEEPGAVAVSDVGVKVESELRIGWGPVEPRPAPPAPSGELLSPRSTPAPAGAEMTLSCTTGAAASSAPPLLGSHQVRAVLGTKAPAPKGSRRETSATTGGRSLDAVALLEEEGPDALATGPTAGPVTWTLRWLDPLELGGKVHAWSGPPPKGTVWGSSVRSAAASGSRAIFAVRAGGKYQLVRTKPGGGIETAEVGLSDLPGSDVVFGTERGEAIAWLRETTLYVWISGEPPRAIASVALGAPRTIGQPTSGGVPVLLGATDWALFKTFPTGGPPASKDPDKSKAKPAPPSLEGWASIANVRRDASRLPACGASPKGLRFAVARATASVSLDGVPVATPAAIYDVRVVPSGEACVAGVTALLSSPAKPKPSGGDKTVVTKSMTFLRADLAAKRAEGGERGIGGEGAVRKLSCGLGAPEAAAAKPATAAAPAAPAPAKPAPAKSAPPKPAPAKAAPPKKK